ncbi:MAG: hypothetical protein QNI90_17005 [Dinoroseobacter sp.]|nr:hypothetical protein [Dinoroseobacter sp.]MDJ0995279.1 hypothetical protein [Dinoroseobacter sp.]
MKPMVLAFAATAVISVGAYFVLGEVGLSSAAQGSNPSSVRLD